VVDWLAGLFGARCKMSAVLQHISAVFQDHPRDSGQSEDTLEKVMAVASLTRVTTGTDTFDSVSVWTLNPLRLTGCTAPRLDAPDQSPPKSRAAQGTVRGGTAINFVRGRGRPNPSKSGT
jgi:hypothetical protein